MRRDEGDRSVPDAVAEPTITIQRAGLILGIGKTTAYKIAREGRLPLIEVSAGRFKVHTRQFLERYGLGEDE